MIDNNNNKILLKIINIILIITLILNMTFFALGYIDGWVFWLTVGFIFLFSKRQLMFK
jgi:hypothetical protein